MNELFDNIIYQLIFGRSKDGNILNYSNIACYYEDDDYDDDGNEIPNDTNTGNLEEIRQKFIEALEENIDKIKNKKHYEKEHNIKYESKNYYKFTNDVINSIPLFLAMSDDSVDEFRKQILKFCLKYKEPIALPSVII